MSAGYVWDVRFKINGLKIPREKLVVSEWLELARIDESTVEAKVVLEGDRREIVKSASHRLMDFLIPYAVLSLQTPNTPKSGQASVVQAWERGGYAPSMAWQDFTIRLAVAVGEEQMQEALESAQAILEELETKPKETAFLRNAFHYAFVASQADRNEDKLINLVISIEALEKSHPFFTAVSVASRPLPILKLVPLSLVASYSAKSPVTFGATANRFSHSRDTFANKSLSWSSSKVSRSAKFKSLVSGSGHST
jgi:hypothetical protein